MRKSPLQGALWKLKGLRVLALVGKSGTGKSFRAKLIADSYKLTHIIDDGLLIRGNTIVAGKSAKNEPHYFGAVKRAVFDDPTHLEEMRRALDKDKVRRLLILGTSEKMVALVTRRLDIPYPELILRMEELVTKEELRRALEDRNRGKHVIPVPAIEVQKNHATLIIDSIKVLLRERFFSVFRPKSWEKTVVRPAFHNLGSLTISEGALRQMVLHCVDEFDTNLTLERCFVKKNDQKYRIDLFLSAPYGLHLNYAVPRLQDYVFESIERYTGIHLSEVNVQISGVK